jgi:hypothetical protein
MPTYERIGYGSPDGMLLGGSSTERIGFYGATPIAQTTFPQISSGNIGDVSTWVSNFIVYLKAVGLSS